MTSDSMSTPPAHRRIVMPPLIVRKKTQELIPSIRCELYCIKCRNIAINPHIWCKQGHTFCFNCVPMNPCRPTEGCYTCHLPWLEPPIPNQAEAIACQSNSIDQLIKEHAYYKSKYHAAKKLVN